MRAHATTRFSRPRHRGAGTRPPSPGILVTAAAAAWLAFASGCAAVPENAVAERLDERTGTTVTAMQKPIELVSTEPRGSNADPFAYVAPFETNRMGRRQLFLWVAVPDERGGAAPPVVLLGEAPLPMAPLGAEPKAAGLATFPYAAPAPWSAMQGYAIDEAALRALAGAATIDVTVRYADGRVIRFSGAPRPATIVTDFVQRLGL